MDLDRKMKWGGCSISNDKLKQKLFSFSLIAILSSVFTLNVFWINDIVETPLEILEGELMV